MAIQWRDQPILDSVQLPGSDTKYWVADSEAREKIETLIGATRFMGVSTTEITDGGAQTPTITDKPGYTQATGDIVIYTPLTGPSLEFIWDGSKWQLLGGQAIENLGDLAYKNSASGSYTPEGSINLTSTTTKVITSVSHNFGIDVSFYNSSTEDGYGQEIDLTLDVELASTPMSLFGSDQALNYINLASRNNHDEIYTSVVTDIDFPECEVIKDFIPGILPTIDNSSTVTVAMGTGSSSTTLIFSLSDIGFNPGTEPSISYVTVCGISGGATYASVSFLTLKPFDVNIVDGISGVVPFYYSIGLTGDIEATTGSALSGVTATFSGSASTITVS